MTKEKIKKALDIIGLPRLIVCTFFFAIVLTAYFSGIDVGSYFSSTLKYWGMWAIIVLAMILFWCVDKYEGYYMLTIGFLWILEFTVLNNIVLSKSLSKLLKTLEHKMKLSRFTENIFFFLHLTWLYNVSII